MERDENARAHGRRAAAGSAAPERRRPPRDKKKRLGDLYGGEWEYDNGKYVRYVQRGVPNPPMVYLHPDGDWWLHRPFAEKERVAW